MHQRTLGSDLHVSAIGHNCMSVNAGYSGRPDTADTAKTYGPHANNEPTKENLNLPGHLADRHGTAMSVQTRPFPRVRS